MAFIENTYIDNLTTPLPSSSEAIFGLIGTIVGSLLTIFLTLYIEKRKENKAILKAGNDFNMHLSTLNQELIVQIKAIDDYITNTKSFGTHYFNINIYHSFDFLHLIDKSKVIEHYLRITTKESKTSFFLNQKFKLLLSISYEVTNLKNAVNNYDLVIIEFEKKYNTELMKFVRKTRDYCDELTAAKIVNDEGAAFLYNLIRSHKLFNNKSFKEICGLLELVHAPITNSNIVIDKTHLLYDSINDFQDNGINIITEFFNDTNRHLYQFKLTGDTIKRAYDALYTNNFIFRIKDK